MTLRCWFLADCSFTQSLKFEFQTLFPASVSDSVWTLRTVGLAAIPGHMARKKVKGSAKEDVPTVEEGFSTFGISGDPINGQSTKASQSTVGGDKDDSPAEAKIPSVGDAASSELQPDKGGQDQKGRLVVYRAKGPSRNKSAAAGTSQEQERSVGRGEEPLGVQGIPKSSAIAAAGVSQTVGKNDNTAESPPEMEVGDAQDPKGKADSSVKAPWVNLFKENRNPSKGFTLKFMDDLPEIPEVRREHALDVQTVWGYSLVGYVAGRFPGKSALLKLCDSWQVKYKYSAHSSGWLIFQFDNESSRDSVMLSGPYTVFGRPLMLKAMPPFFEFDDQNVSFLPVWVNLPALPLECWTQAALSIICSKVGKPISTDSITAARGQFSYARVLIEVDASKELVRSVPFKLSSGKLRVQPVQYEYEPKFCAHCKVFGHTVVGCKVKESDSEAATKDGPASEGKCADGNAKPVLPTEASVRKQVSNGSKQVAQVGSIDPGPSDQVTGVGPEECSSKGADAPTSQEDATCIVVPCEDGLRGADKLDVPFQIVSTKKKREKKHAPVEGSQEADDQMTIRKATHKGAQVEAKKGGGNQPKATKKGSSPLRSR